jgi:transcriptional regulator with XRE-family HTH domain
VQSKATPVLRSIAANVRRVRRQRGLTQETLAERADLGPAFVQKVERGVTNLSVETLVALATALDVKPQDLFEPAELEHRGTGRPPSQARASASKGRRS